MIYKTYKREIKQRGKTITERVFVTAYGHMMLQGKATKVVVFTDFMSAKTTTVMTEEDFNNCYTEDIFDTSKHKL